MPTHDQIAVDWESIQFITQHIVSPLKFETYEKCSFFFKFKKGENFNHMNTLSI